MVICLDRNDVLLVCRVLHAFVERRVGSKVPERGPDRVVRHVQHVSSGGVHVDESVLRIQHVHPGRDALEDRSECNGTEVREAVSKHGDPKGHARDRQRDGSEVRVDEL